MIFIYTLFIICIKLINADSDFMDLYEFINKSYHLNKHHLTKCF